MKNLNIGIIALCITSSAFAETKIECAAEIDDVHFSAKNMGDYLSLGISIKGSTSLSNTYLPGIPSLPDPELRIVNFSKNLTYAVTCSKPPLK